MSSEVTQQQPIAPTADHTVEIPLPRTPARSEQTYQTTTAQPPRGSRFRAFLRALRTTVVVLILLAAAVAGGSWVVRNRMAAQAYVELDKAVLTAEPLPVGTTSAGVVSSLLVSAQSQVSDGQQLARITTTGPDGSPDAHILKAPIDGIVSEINVSTGGVATPGQPVVTMYDPAKLTFQAHSSVDELRRLRLGMSSKIRAEGLKETISARLDRVVPQVGTGQSGGGQSFTVVFTPDRSEVDTVRTLVPGLPFTATVDTKTAANGTPAVNSAR